MRRAQFDQPIVRPTFCLATATRIASQVAVSLAIAFSCLSAQAAVVIREITGLSRPFVLPLPENPNIEIFGGVAGPANVGSCQSADGTAPCSNCVDTQNVAGNERFQPCNSLRIYDNLRVNFFFTSNRVDGRPAVTTDGASVTSLEPTIPGPLVARGQETTASVAWSRICQEIRVITNQGAGGCDGLSGSATIRVGIGANGSATLEGDSDFIRVRVTVRTLTGDTNQGGASVVYGCQSGQGPTEGVCGFVIGSGDRKAVIKQLDSGLTSTTVNFTRIRLLYAEAPGLPNGSQANEAAIKAAFAQITPGAELKQELTLTGEAELVATPSRIDGLKNDTTYVFKAALVDVAGNVGLYTADEADTYCEPYTPGYVDCHVARPSEVAGVLAENQCFVATAAYKSPLAKQVGSLRKFRDEHLLVTTWGTKLVGYYYEQSPKYAKMIADSETLRLLSRILLWPIVGLVQIFLVYGALAAFGVFALFAAAPLAVVAGVRLLMARGARA